MDDVKIKPVDECMQKYLEKRKKENGAETERIMYELNQCGSVTCTNPEVIQEFENNGYLVEISYHAFREYNTVYRIYLPELYNKGKKYVNA